MTVTVYGIACAEGDTAAYRNERGGITAAHTFNRLTASLPPTGAYVDVEHRHLQHGDPPAGQLVYGEITRTGQLHAVATIDGDWLTTVHGPVFWSAELALAGADINHRAYFTASTAALYAIALTRSPAVVASRPLVILPGDVRSSFERSRWPDWRYRHPLLERAVDHIGTSRHPTTMLVDHREAASRSADRYGPMHYGPPGRVLAVG